MPSQAGIELSYWNWKAVRRFVEDRFGLALSRRSPPLADLNYLHRLGFALKRPRKRLLKADPVRRAAFVGEYAALRVAAAGTGTRIFFADEAHFQADADLRGKWVLKGEPARVDSTSPSVPPQGGSQAPLPNRAASKSRRSSWRHPSRPLRPANVDFTLASV
ncbi:MAG: winged helix-turn-helix domain-containing protein [Chloroflexi bacterium]|nr:winged helix-turn-helix domain-containing protein [Chloroflexota bacterium]